MTGQLAGGVCPRVASCRRCGASPLPLYGPGRHQGRGLCSSCGAWLRRVGGLEDYPRVTLTRTETLARYREALRSSPWASLAQLAAQVGMTRPALDMALRRARAAGEDV